LRRSRRGRIILARDGQGAASMHDIVIRGGTIIDGTGKAAFG
jgi:N-acyl-D-aspartate/D-glutamate deacylase